jgi:hypothetical protein
MAKFLTSGRGGIIFDDGTSVYANRSIVGLGPEVRGSTQKYVLAEGYDGEFLEMKEEHIRELAELMIAEWTKVRDNPKLAMWDYSI